MLLNNLFLPLSLTLNVILLIVAYYGNIECGKSNLVPVLNSKVSGSFREQPVTNIENSVGDKAYQSKHKHRYWRNNNAIETYDVDSDGNSSSLFVNLQWEIGNRNEGLKLPSNPKKTFQLIVDVGLELGSGFIVLQPTEPDLVILGFEGHPINFGLSYHNMNRLPKFESTIVTEFNAQTGLNETRRHSKSLVVDRDRFLVVPLACSNYNGYAEFNENYVPACGSILKSKPGGWWCTATTRTIPVPVTRLDRMLAMVPSNYNFYYLKVDTEGADHLVIEGTGVFLSKFKMVSVECRAADDHAGAQSRENNCDREKLTSIMKNEGFTMHICKQEDCHFAKNEVYMKQVINLFTVRAFSDPLYIDGTFDMTLLEKVNLTKLVY